MTLNRTKATLSIAFAVVLGLIILSISIGMTILNTSVKRIDDVVNRNYAKSELILKMRTAGRERTGNLLKMTIKKDPFEVDEEWMQFNARGSNFYSAYLDLKKMELSPEEQQLIKEEEHLIKTLGPTQKKVAELILSDDLEAAHKLLIEKAIPGQQYAFALLSRLMDIQKQNATHQADQAREDYNKTLTTMLLLGTAAILISIIVAYTVIRRITDSEMQLIRSQETLELRVNERTHELKALNQELNKEIETHQMTSKKLVEAKTYAEVANQAKTEFLSRMSHELRTPMNAILGFSQLLSSDTKNPLNAPQQDMLDQVMKGGNHLLVLINEVLDLARIEASNFKLQMENLDLVEVIDSSMALIEPLLDDQQIHIINNISTQHENYIYADSTRIKQIILNFVSNAIKYNRNKGTVTLDCTKLDNNRLRISISDTGYGMKEEDLSRLFRPFERLKNTESNIEGSGIGLVVTKRLVELMNGTIGVTSTLGKGSTFWFELDTGNPVDTSLDKTISIQESSTPKQHHSRQYKVLYIEDNPANMKLMSAILGGRRDIEFMGTDTGESGLELAKKILPEIILLDINLPGINGFEVLQQLQNDSQTTHIPVIGISAQAMEEDIEKALQAGFADYLTKPIDVVKINNMVNKIITAVA